MVVKKVAKVNIDKKDRWDRVVAEVDRIRDSLGMPIDPGIRETVTALWAMGISTKQSCEGHLDRAIAGPWVDVEAEGIEGEEREIDKVWREEKKARKARKEEEVRKLVGEGRKLVKKLKAKHLKEVRKVADLLDSFYAGRIVPFDRRLIIEVYGHVTGRLMNQGTEFQETRTEKERELKLKEYQKEMREFTKFVKDKFFSR